MNFRQLRYISEVARHDLNVSALSVCSRSTMDPLLVVVDLPLL